MNIRPDERHLLFVKAPDPHRLEASTSNFFMALPWFKFYGGDFLSDPKMFGLSTGQKACWITLLCLASMSTEPGIITFLTESQLMLMAGIAPDKEEWNDTKGTLSEFVSLGMVDIQEDKIVIKNFQKRQAIYLTESEKKRKYRENLKQKQSEGTMSTPNRTEQNRTYSKPAKADWGQKPDYKESPKKSVAETKAELKRLIST